MQKILMIEDDTFIQDIVSQKLLEAGYEIKIASRGDEAEAAIAEHEPDLLLLDIDLPGLDGLAVLKNLRTTNKTLPVIIFSNNDDPNIKDVVTQAGAQDFYFKAYTGADELLTKIEAQLA